MSLISTPKNKNTDVIFDFETTDNHQLNRLEESFYTSHARVGLTGFIFDCLAGKQDEELEIDFEQATNLNDFNTTINTTHNTTQSYTSFFDLPISLALAASTNVIMSTVYGISEITAGITNLFSWKRNAVQSIPSDESSELTDVIISDGYNQLSLQAKEEHDEYQEDSSRGNASMNKYSQIIGFTDSNHLSCMDYSFVSEIESPRLSVICESNATDLRQKKNDKVDDSEHSNQLKNMNTALDTVEHCKQMTHCDSGEYIDTSDYWYLPNFEYEEDENEELVSSFHAMESYIDSSMDHEIVSSPIKKKGTRNPGAKVHFEPMVELMDSVVNNDKTAIKKVLQSNKIGINDRDKLGYTMLHYAACHNHLDLIKYLVSKGANVNSLDLADWSPLHLAAIADNYKACKLLMDLGANFECPNDEYNLPVDLTDSDDIKKLLKDAVKKKLCAKKVRALYDWSVEEPENLSIKKGECLRVLEKNQEWWLVQNDSKKIGLVPRIFVQ